MMHMGKCLVLTCMAGFFLAPTAQANVIVLSQLSNTDMANPGQTYTGIIKIKNDGLVEERVSLSQNDYLFFSDGSNIYGEPGVDPRSNAGWIKLAESEVRIAPGMEYEVPYMVSVPARAELIGTYWSLVMVQSITQSQLNPDNQAENTVGVSAGMRYGIQIITNIGDTGKRSLRFFDTKVDKGELYSTLRISLENIGERRLVAEPYADIYSATGKALERIQLSAWGIYPGTSIRIAIPLKDVVPGRYKIQVVADCGGNDLFGAVYSLELK
jgi:hypothetical protein